MRETKHIPALIEGDLPATAVESDAVTLEFHAPRAFPPGRPLACVLWPGTPEALPLAARCIGSKRREDGTFAVRVRLVNLARTARETLLQTFSPGP
jgi:hypothetical protein